MGTFPLVSAVHVDPLRSRKRRFESCRGHDVMSQDIEDTLNPHWVRVFFRLGRRGLPVGW